MENRVLLDENGFGDLLISEMEADGKFLLTMSKDSDSNSISLYLDKDELSYMIMQLIELKKESD